MLIFNTKIKILALKEYHISVIRYLYFTEQLVYHE